MCRSKTPKQNRIVGKISPLPSSGLHGNLKNTNKAAAGEALRQVTLTRHDDVTQTQKAVLDLGGRVGCRVGPRADE